MLDIFALMDGDVYIANNSQLCFSWTQDLLFGGPRYGSYVEYNLDAVCHRVLALCNSELKAYT